MPFSLLGAVQNQSRDWVIDKIAVGVTYDSDLEKARKLIKQAIDENGIKFAFPTVQVAGEGDASAATAAVAQRTLELTHPAAA